MIEVIIIAVVSTVLAFSIAANIYFYIKSKNLQQDLVAGAINVLSLSEEVNELRNLSQMPVSDPEGFIRFLTESRESAFSYIEEVQKAILDLSNALATNDEALIDAAYKKITEYLPGNENS